jgi:hypothetical protein
MSRKIYQAVNKRERPVQWADRSCIFPSYWMHHPVSFFQTKGIDGIKIALFNP